MTLTYTWRQVMGMGNQKFKVLYDLISGLDAGTFIGDQAVATTNIADSAVTAGKLASNAVETAKIKNANVTAAKMNWFVSTEQTGTGSAQNVAHGLAVTPGQVLIIPSGTAGATSTFVQGTHTATNVVVTATTLTKFYAVAMV